MFENINFEELSEIDRSIINYIINNPDLASLMRVRDLANATHVSPSTIIRFVKRLGYDSFTALKLDIQQKLTRDGSMSISKISQLNYTEPLTFESEFEKKIDKLVTKIANSNITYCVGLGSSGIMADYFTRMLNTLGYVSLSSRDAQLPFFWSQDITNKTNNLVIFSTSGETRELVTLTETLRGREPFITTITNHHSNTLATASDLNIAYYITSDRLTFHVDLSSQIPVLFIIETVIRKLHQRRTDANETPL